MSKVEASIKNLYGIFLGFALLFLVLSPSAIAQEVTAVAEVDTSSILIGNQFTLSLKVKHGAAQKVGFPALPDTFSLFEKVRATAIDTVFSEGEKVITRSQHFKFTSFDSGFHVIPPFEFLYRNPGDTGFQKAATEPILISVHTIPVDTTKAIKDIKGQVVIPFSWLDILPYLIAIIAVALIVFLVYYFMKKFRTEKQPEIVKEPWRPADEIALEALQKLDAAKLWQQGNYKGYFTGLSDITRTFIENRWSVMAMEMTTDEILRLNIISGQPGEILRQLKNLLELADLVKFAKVTPVLHENEIAMRQAVEFVKANRQSVEVKEEVA